MVGRDGVVTLKCLVIGLALAAVGPHEAAHAQAAPDGGAGQPGSSFALTIAPSSENLLAGSSVTYTVMSALVTGQSQVLSLSVSGLPQGVAASLNPKSVTVGQSTTLTLSASASAANGTAVFTVTGTSTESSASASARVTVSGGTGGSGGCPSGFVDVGGVCIPGGCSYGPASGPSAAALVFTGVIVGLTAIRRRRRARER